MTTMNTGFLKPINKALPEHIMSSYCANNRLGGRIMLGELMAGRSVVYDGSKSTFRARKSELRRKYGIPITHSHVVLPDAGRSVVVLTIPAAFLATYHMSK